jgi:hypothetical protein
MKEKTMTMTQLVELNKKCHAHLHAICQLSLEKWIALAKSLGVALNGREEAAKKLAIREMQLKKEK